MMLQLFKIGDMLYGFCNGYFGSADYDNKVCVMVTPEYAVFQYINGFSVGKGVVLNYDTGLTKELINNWKKNE